MHFFSKIENAFVLLKTAGVYRQADLYRRGEHLFAKAGAGYIRLGISGETSAPRTHWLEIDPGQDAGNLDTRNGVMPAWLPAKSKKSTKLKAA